MLAFRARQQPGSRGAQLLHEGFEVKAQSTPKATAVVYEERRLSYGSLNTQANRLSRHLRKLGVGPEVRVGVCIERSPEMVISILAILKAGAAYVPLDPSYPRERLKYMLEDADAPVVITSQRQLGSLPVDVGRIVCVDASRAEWEQGEASNPESGAVGKNLAYVIYTSGSTGLPKGVCITHETICNHMEWMQSAFSFTAADRFLQKTPFSFDASVWEFYAPLLCGATLVMTRPDGHRDPDYLIAAMIEYNITTLQLVPSQLAMLLQADRLEECRSLRRLFCGGEALEKRAIEDLLSRLPGCELITNLYGPTECTIDATSWSHVSGVVPERVPIGRPIANVQAYVLSESGELASTESSGELFIGGSALARGYLNRPELTATAFVPDPFSGQPGARLYKTGDLVRWNRAEELEYLGRKDQQVKIRGHRVELGEIEEILRKCSGVGNAVVVLRHGQLAAFVVSDQTDTETIRTWCTEQLPSHMVPANIAILAKLPLTPSGKIDRAKLPELDRASAGLTQAPIAARTHTEHAILGLMSELLGISEVGVSDNFFILGGHSLLAGRLAARLRSQFKVALPLKAIYDQPTAAALGALIDGERVSDAPTGPPSPPPLRRARRDQPIPLSFPQERVWYLDRLAASNRAYQFQATFRLRGPLNHRVLTEALNEIVRRHEIFHTRFIETNGRPSQELVPPATVEVPLIDLSHLPSEKRAQERNRILSAEMSRKMHPAVPPLVRWVLLREGSEGSEEYVLFHMEHHLVHDGWSFAMFIAELVRLYDACLAAQASLVPEPTLQFADLAVWQRNWLTGDVLASFLDHWTKLLVGAPAALEYPTDRPRPAEFSFRGSALRVDFTPAEYSELQAAARRHGVTLFTIMFSGFISLLSRYADQSDVVIGVGAANRRLEEAERLIGMIVNTLPVRVDLSDDPMFSELLRRVHAITVDAYEWQDVPLDSLVEALGVPRTAARNPLFSALFSFHDAAVPDLNFGGGVRGDVAAVHNETAKTDLNIVVVPRAEQRVGRSASEENQSLYLVWEYSTDLFDRESMEQMVTAYRHLLATAIADPSLAVSRLPIHASQAVTTLALASVSPFPSLGELVDRWVRERPDATAISHGKAKLTYRELDRRAYLLAQRLRALGAGPSTPVAVLLERGLDMITAMLASLRAGAPCLIVDSEASAAELEKATAGAVVCASETFQQHSAAIASPDANSVRSSGSLSSGGQTESASSSDGSFTQPSSVVHLLYPEQVGISDRALVLMTQALEAAGFSPSRVAQIADPISPLLLIEVWGTLARGGNVCIVPEPASDPMRLSAALTAEANEGGFSGVVLPEAAAEVIAVRHPDSLAEVKTLLVVGTHVDGHISQALRNHGNPTHVLAGFGTANLPLAFWCQARDHAAEGGNRPLLPRSWPFPGVAAEVRDGNGLVLPPGIPGNLYLGIAGTQEIVPTDWRARYCRDGGIEVLGPIGERPAIRGYRVSLAEIRAAVKAHPSVEDAMLVVRDGVLINYFSGKPGSAPLEPEMLRTYLAEQLPSYEVPAIHVLLPALPLDRFGQVDLSRLCMQQINSPIGQPLTPTQRRIAALFAQVLNCEVGLHEDFFEMGGRSLLAIQLVLHVNQQFGVNVSMARFLREPTVATLATAVEESAPAHTVLLRPGLQRQAGRLLAELDNLSDDHVEALLQEMEGKSGS